jgi:hypothetical protein
LDEDIVRGEVFVSQCQRSSRAQQLISNRARGNCVFSPAASVSIDVKKWRFITGQGQRLPGVKTDEHGISTHYPDGTVLLIRWDEVQCVAVETNDSGTWGADVWWLIEGN